MIKSGFICGPPATIYAAPHSK